MNAASDFIYMNRFVVSFIRRANDPTWVSPISFNPSRYMWSKTYPLVPLLTREGPTSSVITLIVAAHLETSSQIHSSSDVVFFLHPYKTIKLLCGVRILAQSQCGALSCHKCASDIQRDGIIIILKENLDRFLSFSNRSHCYTTSLLAESNTFCYS